MKPVVEHVVSARIVQFASHEMDKTRQGWFSAMRLVRLAFVAGLVLAGVSAAKGDADFYVATTGDDAGDGSQASPFATIGAAIAAADAAVGGGMAAAVTIQVAEGTYVGSGHVLSNAITICGAGADRTIFDGDGGYRVFSLMSSDAALKNLAVSNAVFTAAEDSGAGVYMEAGLVEGCAIVSCGDFSHSKTRGGGVYASGGRISCTVFTGNKVLMRWSNDVGYGSALYLSNGAVCENSLFTGNVAVPCPDFDADRRRGGVVHMTGDGTALVNCSVVENRLADPAGYGNIAEKYSGIVSLVNATVVNCVAYGNIPDAAYATGNWDVYAGGDEWRNNPERYIFNSAWETVHCKEGTTPPTPSVAVNEASFADYAKGDYAPAPSGPLFGSGSDAKYDSYASSATDLAGVPRPQGSAVEIGCYEVDERTLSFSADADSYGVLLGTASTFTAVATGGGGSYTFNWDFGDGTPQVTTVDTVVQHAYAAGLYRASVSLSLDGGATRSETVELRSMIAVAPADIYVNAANANPVFPYDTPAKAATTLADAYGCLTNTVPETLNMAVVDGVTVHVAAGTHVGSGYVLAGAVTVVGEGAKQAVVDGNGGYRVFSLVSPRAALKNLVVSNGVFTAAEQSGAGVYMEAGLIEGCLITDCGSFNTVTNYGGGVYASGGRISRTVFTGNKVQMRWSSDIGYGSALYLSNGAICENSLFTGNAAAPCFEWGADHRRGGVVYLTDSGTALVNCTVVKNDLADAYGNTADSFAGIVQKSNSKVINCVACGNAPDAEYVKSYGDVYAGGDTWRNNWQNYFVNSAWGTWITKTVNLVTVETPPAIGVDYSAFKNYSSGKYAPKAKGVLVNAGTSWADYLGDGGRSETDLAGKPRLKSGRLDIGCYENEDLGLCVIVR
ncbi:MAG: PKD domain-containing protein [Kiritimatiellae bacterium]|nr:PKD domain-containing protein [Kiritimatiellia bacterium]